jgi:hypothetical protein
MAILDLELLQKLFKICDGGQCLCNKEKFKYLFKICCLS